MNGKFMTTSDGHVMLDRTALRYVCKRLIEGRVPETDVKQKTENLIGAIEHGYLRLLFEDIDCNDAVRVVGFQKLKPGTSEVLSEVIFERPRLRVVGGGSGKPIDGMIGTQAEFPFLRVIDGGAER